MTGEREPFTDAHVHFWDHGVPGLRWRFLEPGFEHPRLRNTQSLDAPAYGPAELAAEAGAQRPDRTIHVQCAYAEDPLLENHFIDGLARRTGSPDAFVAGARLRDAAVAELIERHAAWNRCRGVRDLTVQGSVTPDEVAPAFDAARRHAISIELMLPPEHYGVITTLAQRWPDVTIVLGHAGQPAERTATYLGWWAAALANLAATTDGVVLKLSAIASSADPDWTTDSIRPCVTSAIEAFGPERCMLASNWPIDRLYGTYERLISAYREIIAPMSPDERRAVLSGTAARVYGL